LFGRIMVEFGGGLACDLGVARRWDVAATAKMKMEELGGLSGERGSR